MSLTVVILTFNEELHLERAIRSVKGIADRIVIVDSGSTDQTAYIARANGAELLVNPFVNHAQQFNWVLDQLPEDTDWVFRLDADEVVTSCLAQSLADNLCRLPQEVSGVSVNRRMCFMRRPIRWGGVFPLRVVRIFRFQRGRSEDRWMDEHIAVDGLTVNLTGELIDDSLQSLGWWIEKHNRYASREVIEILNEEYNIFDRKDHRSVSDRARYKRWIKRKIYNRLPLGVRAFAYFLYRYVVRFGFLDGKEGAAFHILQGFWYRYIVDIKLYEVKTYMAKNKSNVKSAIHEVLGVELDAQKSV